MKLFFLFAIIIFCSCKKDDNPLSVSQILIEHDWYLFQTRTLSYDSTSTGWTLRSDTTVNSDSCAKVSKNQFYKDYTFFISATCFNSSKATGIWALSADSLLRAVIPQQSPLGQTYYIGINGHVSKIDESQFIIMSNVVFNSFAPWPKDSIATIYTYKN